MEDKNNKMLEILARKKAMQSNKSGDFNPTNSKKIKPQKGFSGPSVTRKTGRGS